jgi:PAP2 superfamily protein
VSTATRRATRLPGGRRLSDGHLLYWWLEVLAILAFYLIYSAIRNANEGGTLHAFHNAQHIISVEHHLGLYHEETMQRWALHFKPIIIMANYFYGSLHFVVTIFTGIWLYRRFSDDYPRFRNALAITTAIALVGFVTFPLMPPRLLHTMEPSGFVDTLAKYPTIWSFNSGAASKISNQYAAMPSVHIAWATWCAVALVPRVRSGVAKVLAFCYPFFTVIVIVITANHYILDAVAGAAIFCIGWFMSGQITRAGRGDPVPVA